eukprot:scaffold142583_cov29-Tisochrysis_lutea.AAC.1
MGVGAGAGAGALAMDALQGVDVDSSSEVSGGACFALASKKALTWRLRSGLAGSRCSSPPSASSIPACSSSSRRDDGSVAQATKALSKVNTSRHVCASASPRIRATRRVPARAPPYLSGVACGICHALRGRTERVQAGAGRMRTAEGAVGGRRESGEPSAQVAHFMAVRSFSQGCRPTCWPGEEPIRRAACPCRRRSTLESARPSNGYAARGWQAPRRVGQRHPPLRESTQHHLPS